MKNMNKSFKNRLFLNFLLVALITLCISGGFLITAVRTKAERDYEKRSLAEIENIQEALSNYFDDMNETILRISKSENITGAIDETDGWLQKKAYSSLYELTEDYRDRSTFFVYNNEGKCVYSTSSEEEIPPLPLYWGILRLAYTHPEDVIIRNGTSEAIADDAVLHLTKAVTVDDECAGYILISISPDNMSKILRNTYSSDSEVIIFDEFWDKIYSSDAGEYDNISEMMRNRQFNNEDPLKHTDGFIFSLDHMEDHGISIVLGKESVFTDSLIHTMIYVILLMAVVAMLVSLIFSILMSRMLMKPLDEMTYAMDKARQGDLSVQMKTDRIDEFGQLSEDFNDMINALRMYVELRSRQQQELNDSNVAMMQAQLNPHFLYNTLDTIKWIAKANNIPQLATISSSLAKILRASISGDNFVTLKKEIELVENYIDIQQIRFSGKFTYDAEIPIELEDAIIPKLILQPVVENAIVHGLKDKENGHIFINAYSRDLRLIIEVEDDGCGMSDEMIGVLNRRDREELKGHIGFYNVDTIIRLNYGLNYGLSARNLPSGGVRMTMELPLKPDGSDQGSDED